MNQWNNIKIGQKLFIAFGTIIALTAVLGFVSYSTISAMTNDSFPAALANDNVVKQMLEMRKNEKDFLARESSNPDFFETGESNYLTSFYDNFERLEQNLALVRKYAVAQGDAESISNIDSAGSYAQEYYDTFLVVADKIKEKGFKDWGLVGDLRDSVHDVEYELNSLDDIDELMISMLMCRRHEKDYLLRNDVTYQTKLASEVETFKEKLDASSLDATVKAQLLTFIEHYKTSFDAVVTIDEEIGRTEDQGLNGAYRESIHQLEPLIDMVHTSVITSLDTTASSSMMILIITFIGALTIGIVFYILIIRSVSKPLATIAKEAETVGRTLDFSQRFSIQGKDEIGQMSTNLNTMMQSVRGPFHDMMDYAKKVSKGDLTVQFKEQAQGDVLTLRNSIQEMVTSLSDIVRAIKHNTHTMASSAEELSSSAEEVNASMEEVSSTIQQVATGSQNTAKDSENMITQVKQANDSSSQGQHAAQDVSQKMQLIKTTTQEGAERISALGEKSKEIGHIVDTIDQISEQTNLLALNAAIEAARAGEAGRGFAVVADEVRKLAEESGNATQQISSLIKGIQGEIDSAVTSMNENSRQVEEGSAGVQQAMQAFDVLPEVIASVTKSAEAVSAIAQESASSSEEVSASIEEVTSSMQQVASASQQMADISNTLQQLVDRFIVNDDFSATNKDHKTKAMQK
jgi:methyl-accepting chemotaxis protein